MLPGGSVQYRPSQVRIEFGEIVHDLDGKITQMLQSRRLAFAEEQFVMLADFFLDLRVVRQNIAAQRRISKDLLRRLAFGGCIVGAVFHDHPGGGDRDFGA